MGASTQPPCQSHMKEMWEQYELLAAVSCDLSLDTSFSKSPFWERRLNGDTVNLSYLLVAMIDLKAHEP